MAEFIYHILIERQLRKGGTNEIFLKKLASYYYRVVSCKAAAAMTNGLWHGSVFPPCLFPSSPRAALGGPSPSDCSPSAGLETPSCGMLPSGPGFPAILLTLHSLRSCLQLPKGLYWKFNLEWHLKKYIFFPLYSVKHIKSLLISSKWLRPAACEATSGCSCSVVNQVL